MLDDGCIAVAVIRKDSTVGRIRAAVMASISLDYLPRRFIVKLLLMCRFRQWSHSRQIFICFPTVVDFKAGSDAAIIAIY